MSLSLSGMHIGPIPAASIDRAAVNYPGEESDFRACIRAMDSAYLNYVRKPADSKSQHRVNRSRTFGPDMMRSTGK